jgi:hypothetical protein
MREEIPEYVLDHDVLVPNIADAITIFLHKLLVLLRENQGEFYERFSYKTQNRRKIVAKPHPVKAGAVTFTRITDQGVVELYLPRVRGGYAPNSSFGHDLEESLDGLSFADPQANLAMAGEEDNEEYVDIGGTKTWAAKVVFPDVSQLPRPENLLKQTPLYLRLMESGNKFTLEGHQPTVDLVYEYLKKHARDPLAPNSRELSISRRKLTWGTSLSCLAVSDERLDYSCSALVVVALLEGTLGYERIGDVNNGTWLFRRATDFTS